MEEQSKPSPNKLAWPVNFNPTEYLRPGFTEFDILELKNAFDTFDLDKSGSIDIKELKSTIESQNLEFTSADVFQLILEIDSDNSGQIEFPEFLNLISGQITDENSKSEITKMFNVFDIEKKGHISFDNLKQLVQNLGLQLSDSTLLNLISKGDSNSDNLVSFEDFYNIMTKTIV